jgi:hypothetical protein
MEDEPLISGRKSAREKKGPSRCFNFDWTAGNLYSGGML